MMTDLFTEAVECHKAERAGIPRATAEAMAERSSEEFLHQCEVRQVAAMFREQGKDAVVEFLEKVEKHRGAAAMEKLRADAIAEVKRLKSERGQNA